MRKSQSRIFLRLQYFPYIAYVRKVKRKKKGGKEMYSCMLRKEEKNVLMYFHVGCVLINFV